MASVPGNDHESRAVRALREIFDSGRPLVYVRSAEEQRVAQLLREAVRRSPGEASRVWTWSLTEAMRCDDGTGEAGASAPRAALDFIVAHEKPAVFHLKDFHEPLRSSAEVRRRLRDVYDACLGQGKFVVITSPVRFIPDELERSIADLGHVGGLEDLKQWLLERRKLFQLGDDLGADIVPKGVLVMGISGCGKSLSVKAIASYFALPLYRIDMIEIFSGRHGSPEGAFVQACHMLESMAPAVVWFDEIEAGINAQAQEGELGRIFGFFLTWMQAKARGLFVGATANRIDLLPAEMIRKGRFDEVFFVDLPLDDERLDIFRVHLRRRGI